MTSPTKKTRFKTFQLKTNLN